MKIKNSNRVSRIYFNIVFITFLSIGLFTDSPNLLLFCIGMFLFYRFSGVLEW